jgi:hypothetical protein
MGITWKNFRLETGTPTSDTDLGRIAGWGTGITWENFRLETGTPTSLQRSWKTLGLGKRNNGPYKGNIFLVRMSFISDIIPAGSRERSLAFYISVNSFSIRKICNNSYRQHNLSQARDSQVRKKVNIISQIEMSEELAYIINKYIYFLI